MHQNSGEVLLKSTDTHHKIAPAIPQVHKEAFSMKPGHKSSATTNNSNVKSKSTALIKPKTVKTNRISHLKTLPNTKVDFSTTTRIPKGTNATTTTKTNTVATATDKKSLVLSAKIPTPMVNSRPEDTKLRKKARTSIGNNKTNPTDHDFPHPKQVTSKNTLYGQPNPPNPKKKQT